MLATDSQPIIHNNKSSPRVHDHIMFNLRANNSHLKTILLFGAGKSAGALITFLIKAATTHKWQLLIADNSETAIRAKTHNDPIAQAIAIDIVQHPSERISLIARADVVISLMPHTLHRIIAEDCLALQKHLLTASYVDESIRKYSSAIKDNQLLFLCEMGLDPGIDHMSALSTIHNIQQQGGRITAFRSHCGGLVAPESDNNPWHYKISWNPRNVVLAGKAGATYKENGIQQQVPYERLFQATQQVIVSGLPAFSFYPNRDSLSYAGLYGLAHTDTFIRTTLRHPAFCHGWQRIIELGLTDETTRYQTNNQTLAGFYQTHFEQQGHAATFAKLLSGHEDPVFTEQLRFLGLHSSQPINKGLCSAADVLQFVLENKLALQPADKDMVVMLHEITYEKEEQHFLHTSSLIVKGENSNHTAMARTVGTPLGIAAILLLQNKLTLRGLHIPTLPQIYEPVLEALKEEGITFEENSRIIPH